MKNETIFMEISQKYTLIGLDEITVNKGFQPIHNFFDSRKCFMDTVWEMKENVEG